MTRMLLWAALCVFAQTALSQQSGQPWLELSTANPRYLQYDGRPILLVTSGEHYGAVLNKDFDFRKYCDTLAADGLNLTRVFSGAYFEHPGAFDIAKNTLAPPTDRVIVPWAQVKTGADAQSAKKYDLDRWDEAYFVRLKDFVSYAASKQIVVEMNIFCPFYDAGQWKLSPMNPANNVQMLPAIKAEDVYTLDKHGGLLAVQEALVRKLCDELKGAGNVYFEICNEPYAKNVAEDWQRHITNVLAKHEEEWERKHLISWNIANEHAVVENPHPRLSIFNFHYAWPPVVVGMNPHLQGVLGDNETGFDGASDAVYRREAWEFLLAGGGLFNNLDYSFAVGHEDGSYAYPPSQPGGGSNALRRQLGLLRKTLEGLDFVRMKSHANGIASELPDGATCQFFGSLESGWVVYCHGWPKDGRVLLGIDSGTYAITQLDPANGNSLAQGEIAASKGLTLPAAGISDVDVVYLLTPKKQ